MTSKPQQKETPETTEISGFTVVGLTIRTNNKDGGAAQPYSLTIGCRIRPDADIALVEGLSSVYVENGDYMVFAAQGPQPKALTDTWQAIWKSDLKRAFKTDVEIYGPRFFEEGLHEILVCVGVKP